MPFVMRVISSVGTSIGHDHGPVSPRYTAPFAFTGTLERVEITLVRSRPGGAAELAATDERSTTSRQ